MKFTKTMTANLEKLMKRHDLSDGDLQLLGEVLTEAYENGLKDCLSDYERAVKNSKGGDYYEQVKSGQYMYVTTHGIGPGAYPKDLAGYRCLPDGRTQLFFDRVLDQSELDEYDIKAEWES